MSWQASWKKPSGKRGRRSAGLMCSSSVTSGTQARRVQVSRRQARTPRHLWERDCSVQRRHQKVVEICPEHQPCAKTCDAGSATLPCASARRCLSVCRHREFLVDMDRQEFHFIEVTRAFRSKHTVTEMVTASTSAGAAARRAGHRLHKPPPPFRNRRRSSPTGWRLQCRIYHRGSGKPFHPRLRAHLDYRSPAALRYGSRGNGFGGPSSRRYSTSLPCQETRGQTLRRPVRQPIARCANSNPRRSRRTSRFSGISLFIHLHSPGDHGIRGTRRRIYSGSGLRPIGANKSFPIFGDVSVNGRPALKANGSFTGTDQSMPPPVNRESPPSGLRQSLQQLDEKFSKWVPRRKSDVFPRHDDEGCAPSSLATRGSGPTTWLAIADAVAHPVRNLSVPNVGGQPSIPRAVCRRSMGAARETARAHPEHPLSDAAREQHGVTPLIRTTSSRPSSTRAADSGIDASAYRSLNSTPNMKVAIDARAEQTTPSVSGHCYTGDILDPGAHERRLIVLREDAKSWTDGPTSSASKTWPACATIRGFASSRHCGRRDLPIHFHTPIRAA